MTYKTNTKNEYHEVLDLEWIKYIETIDLEGEQIQEEINDRLAPEIGILKNKIYVQLPAERDILEQRKSRVVKDSPAYIEYESKIEIINKEIENLQTEAKKKDEELEAAKKEAKQPIVIQREYHNVQIEREYGVAIEYEAPSELRNLKDYYQDIVCYIYKQMKFSDNEYVGMRIMSIVETEREYQGNNFKGWRLTRSHYELEQLYLGRLSKKHEWRVTFEKDNTRAKNIVSAILDSDEETAASGEVYRAAIEEVKSKYEDKDKDGKLEMTMNTKAKTEKLTGWEVVLDKNELAVKITGKNIKAMFINNKDEIVEEIKLNEIIVAQTKKIVIETIRPIRIKRAKIRNAYLLKDIYDEVENKETEVVLETLGEYWGMTDLVMAEQEDPKVIYTNKSTKSPPGMEEEVMKIKKDYVKVLDS